MKASINLDTGLLIESQSHADDSTLIANAASAGFNNVEIRTVSQAELDLLITAKNESRMTQNDRFKAIERAIEKHMDTVAQADNWDNRWTCVARAGYVNPWQAKGIKFAQWMDSCWLVAIQAQQDVSAGIRAIPTPEQAVAELPPMVW